MISPLLVEERNPTVNITPSRALASFKLSVVFSLVIMGLGACQPLVPPTLSPPIQTASQTASPPAPTTAEENVAAKTDTGPSVEPNVEPASEAITTAGLATAITPAPATIPAPKPPEITDIDPRSFLGKPVQDMTDILGRADFMRVEGQIGIWQFRQENCVVDFFFRAADAQGELSAQLITALDIRGRYIGQPLDEKGCRKELYQRRL